MQRGKGIVCIARTVRKAYVFFGKNMHPRKVEGLCENFFFNGMTPFRTVREARRARADLLSRHYDFVSVRLARITFVVAETVEELARFEKSRSIIVLWKYRDFLEGGMDPLGPVVGKLPTVYPLPAASFLENGMKSFPSRERALYVLAEVNRQAESAATLASLTLQWL